MSDHAVPRVEVFPVSGIGELRPGDDLVGEIAAHAADLRDGDVVVVTSKVVSKVEGRLLPVDGTDPGTRERARQAAVDAETARVVAQRDELKIVKTRQGLVLAAAGVDASNVASNEIALLPVDPDGSAASLREGLKRRVGIDVGVIVSDSMGRPWRAGITDNAIGVAGLSALFDARGQHDRYGNELAITQVAVADEVAAAADLVKGKLGGIPVAVVRGLGANRELADDGLGARALLRSADEDLFRLGTAEAIALGREDAAGATVTPPPLHADAVQVVTSLSGLPEGQASIRQGFLGFLAARPDAMWRSCAAGHLTASALVVDPERQAVLLTLHPRAGMWLQLGGHCESGDHTLLDAAARESREESGIGSLSFDPTPISLDIHPITCSLGIPTRHFDVSYLAVSPHGAEAVVSSESLDLRWFSWDELPPGAAPELPRLINEAKIRLGI